MITLDYNLDPSEIPVVDAKDLASATHTDLDYYLFCGSVVFRIDGTSFDAQWGWIPIFDFATQLFLIVCQIKDAEVRTLEFTESEATIEFRRQGSKIQVSAEYASATAEAPLQDLRQTASAFFRSVLDDVSSRWPQITDNPFYSERRELLKTRCVD